MKTCAICSTPLTVLNTGLGNKLKNGEKLCLSCINKLDYDTRFKLRNLTVEDVLLNISFKKTNKSQNKEEQFLKETNKYQNKIVEYKRTCLQCGKVWHSLASREKYLEKEKRCNDCNMCASAFGSAGGNSYSWGTWTQTKRNEHALNNEINRLKQCPNCMSSNYTEEPIVYEKQ